MLSIEGWINCERPGYLGKHRDERFAEWNEKFGRGNWRLVWKIGNRHFDFQVVCMLYEDAYFEFLKSQQHILDQLINEAAEVYDYELSDIDSGLNYLYQESNLTHIQDIAIRRVLVRFGLWFKGTSIIRIRQEKGNHPLSTILSPGRVPFHRLDLIEQPEIVKWWHPGTIESFYQNNRLLQIKSDCGVLPSAP